MLGDREKKTAQAIVNIFETGRVRGDYGSVTFHPQDPGHLTYGRSQTTLASGNLYLLIKTYCDRPDAEFAASLQGYLAPLAQRDTMLDHDFELRKLLSEAARDCVMCDVQDRFFDRVYWGPAERAAANEGVTLALGIAVVYDSYIHGSWRLIRDRTNSAELPPAADEKKWVAKYVESRKNWLENHSNSLLQRTVYRMNTFQQLIEDKEWDLPLPLRIRGVDITEAVLLEDSIVRVSAHTEERDRILRLETPFMTGEDVRILQEALNKLGNHLSVDGVFGRETGTAVIEFQRRHNFITDGIVGPVTRTALGI
jgi:chitosanase